MTLQCLLACMIAGRPYLPLDPSCPAARALGFLRNAGASLLLAPEPLETCLPTLDRAELYRAAASGAESPYPERDQSAPFYILYTSGSTGKPKGVRVGEAQLLSFTAWARTLAPEGGVWVNTAPYSFDLSAMALFPALTAGAALCDLPRTDDYQALFAALAGSGATVLVATPSFASLCLADRSFCRSLLPRLRAFLFCGETLPPKTALRLMDRFPEAAVVNCYGPTETTVAVTAVTITRALCRGPLPVGYAKHGSRIAILDGALKPLSDGTEGQIAIFGDTVAAYMDGSEENFPVLGGERAYLTGDLGHMEKGLLFFHRRMDRQLKYRGYRISPQEIEAALLSLDGVRQAAVLPRMRGDTVAGLTAFAACEGDGALLRERLLALLPAYMVPGRIVCMPRLPVNANGKCDYKKLMEMISNGG